MKIVAALLALTLTGCASLDGALQNRVTCSPDRKEATFCSFYGNICIGSKIDPRDAAICRK